MRVVARRVDSLTLAYRVELHPALLAHLEGRARVARKRGRAAVDFGGLVGELGYSRADRCWTITGARYNVRIDLKAPGGKGMPDESGYEPGWVLEIVWRAQALAALGDVGLAVAEGKALAIGLGTERTKDSGPIDRMRGGVYEACTRRIDLCADVAGKVVDAADVERLVRRPRCKYTIHDNHAPRVTTLPATFSEGRTRAEIKTALLEAASADVHGGKRTTGISVGRGGVIMGRIYDKRVEIEGKAVRIDEELRFLGGGWRAHRSTCEGTDGARVVWLDEDPVEIVNRWNELTDALESPEPVTRVEFQIRGAAMREFGIRDPECAVDPQTKLPAEHENAQGTRLPTSAVMRMAPELRAAWRPVLVPLADRVDALWQRCLDWMRLVKVREERTRDCVDDPLWTLLRAVTFTRRATPAKRFRVRGGASADQVLGCVLSILSVHQSLSYERTDYGENESADDTSESEVVARVEAVMRRAAPKIAAHLVGRWGPVKALEHLGEINNSARARFLETSAAAVA